MNDDDTRDKDELDREEDFDAVFDTKKPVPPIDGDDVLDHETESLDELADQELDEDEEGLDMDNYDD